MKKLSYTFLFLAFFFLYTPLSQAQTLNPELESKALDLESSLIAPCCWTQPVAIHPSGISDRMKTEIRKMLSEGKTKQQILDHYVAIHGTKVLSIPPQEGFNRLSFLMPIIVGLLGLIAAFYFMNKWSANKQKITMAPQQDPKTSKSAQSPNSLEERFKDELKNF